MRKNPERLAWIVLLISFFTCVSLAVFVPLGGRWYVLNARTGQNVTLDVQQPPLRVIWAGQGQPVSVAQDPDDNIPERTIVGTWSTTSGQLVVHAPYAKGPIITTVQIYGNTEVVLLSARSPRFLASRLPHEVTLEVKTGRVRINVSDGGDKSTVVEVHTSHGVAVLTEGSYDVKVNKVTTEVIVREGQANVSDDAEHTVLLEPAERAVIDGEQVATLPAPRDLILNSHFGDPLGGIWSSYSKDIEFEGEPRGKVSRTKVEGRPVVVITREGIGHAETGIRQQLDVDVHDLSFLQLHLLLRIEEHDVPLCGSQGSECPVMVHIAYKDAHGTDREWLQGFYSLLDTSAENPLVCVTCSTRNPHIRVSEGTWYPYLSPNLIPLLSQDGQPPTLIEAVTVYASGHTYQSMVAEVELLAEE